MLLSRRLCQQGRLLLALACPRSPCSTELSAAASWDSASRPLSHSLAAALPQQGGGRRAAGPRLAVSLQASRQQGTPESGGGSAPLQLCLPKFCCGCGIRLQAEAVDKPGCVHEGGGPLTWPVIIISITGIITGIIINIVIIISVPYYDYSYSYYITIIFDDDDDDRPKPRT